MTCHQTYLLWVGIEQTLDSIGAHSCLATRGPTEQLQTLSSYTTKGAI
jgi:hypothetical protein